MNFKRMRLNLAIFLFAFPILFSGCGQKPFKEEKKVLIKIKPNEYFLPYENVKFYPAGIEWYDQKNHHFVPWSNIGEVVY